MLHSYIGFCRNTSVSGIYRHYYVEQLRGTFHMSAKSDQQQHWAATKRLTFLTLVIWAVVSFVIHWFGSSLNSESFPGAYFMAGMGSQVMFVLLVFWFSVRQNSIDEEYGMSEGD